MKKGFVFLIIALFLSGCFYSVPTSDNFEAKPIQTSHLSIAVWEKNTIQKGKPLRLYFEGNGNPNPRYTIAFDFARRDSSSNVIYIAQPCQWVNDKICKKKPEIYNDSRFHREIMDQMKELVEYLIRKHQAPSIELIGYDGGAVIALNIASSLPTTRLITIAGITDIDAYNTYHDLPLQEEEQQENPADNLLVLSKIPQIHYVGKDDDITPKILVEKFVSKMKNPTSAVVKVVPDTNHTNWEGIKLDY